MTRRGQCDRPRLALRFGRYDRASVPAFSRNAKYHAAITLAVGGLFLYFIVSSALQLR